MDIQEYSKDIVSTLEDLSQRYVLDYDPLIQKAIYLIIELCFEEAKRQAFLGKSFLGTVDAIARATGVTWTILRREGGLQWSSKDPKWVEFNNLAAGLKYVKRKNENDSTYFYMLVTSVRADYLIAYYEQWNNSVESD